MKTVALKEALKTSLPHADFSDRVFRPRSEHEIQLLYRHAQELGASVATANHGNTRTADILVDLAHMEAFESFDEKSNIVTVQAGMRLRAIDDSLRARGKSASFSLSVDQEERVGASIDHGNVGAWQKKPIPLRSGSSAPDGFFQTENSSSFARRLEKRLDRICCTR
ncbi:MAG: FAD-binding protein [Polyangiales bacterium]